MNRFDWDIKTTNEIAKKILARMGELKIPLIPENYRLWFEYYMGRNKDLVKDFNRLIEISESFTPVMSQTLYDKYFGEEQGNKLFEKIQDETRTIVKNFLNQMLITSDSTSDYTVQLRTYSDQLDIATDLSDIQEIIENMKIETNEMVGSTSNLRDQLEEATAKAEDLKEKLETTTREALIDAVTGLHNRKSFDRKIRVFYEEFKKDGDSFSVIMLDIDHFKKFNDKYGHKVGDEVLNLVGSVMYSTLKGQDFPARYGGEEFMVLLPRTLLDNACILAEQLRKNISMKKFKLTRTGERIDTITVSLGVSEIRSEDTVDSLIERADKALYLAKNSGRNNYKSEKDF